MPAPRRDLPIDKSDDSDSVDRPLPRQRARRDSSQSDDNQDKVDANQRLASRISQREAFRKAVVSEKPGIRLISRRDISSNPSVPPVALPPRNKPKPTTSNDDRPLVRISKILHSLFYTDCMINTSRYRLYNMTVPNSILISILDGSILL